VTLLNTRIGEKSWYIIQVVNKVGSIPTMGANHRSNYPMTDGFETIGMVMVYGAQ
jgi:hypothetical protein